MPHKHFRSLRLIDLLLITVTLTGCAAGHEARDGMAQDIALRSQLSAREIVAAPYLLTVYDRIPSPGTPANLYIEGDGLAWLGRNTISPDPTPTDPVALRLAALDPAANVIYLARPCQYSKMSDPQQACNNEDWTGGRFSPRVIAAMNDALNQIKAQTKVSGFNLIGYSGGGGIAALLTAQRDDVLSLRSVAGLLDHKRFTEDHKISPLTQSLNPVDVAYKIAAVPQLHFIGGDDNVVTEDIFQSFLDSSTLHSASSGCIRSEIVPVVTHNEGWVERWPELLKHTVGCPAH